jgi:hypothetical protein
VAAVVVVPADRDEKAGRAIQVMTTPMVEGLLPST